MLSTLRGQGGCGLCPACPTSLPPSPVPHAPADKGVPPLSNFLTLSSRSVYQLPGQGGGTVRGSRAKTWYPSQASGALALSQRQKQAAEAATAAAALPSQVQARCFRTAPPRPAHEATISHWLLSRGPPAVLPPGARARRFGRYSRLQGS